MMRVCYFGTYRASYVRNRLMIERLRAAGIQVVECHEPLWFGDEDRELAASGGWLDPRFWWRVLRTYARLLWRYRTIGSYDVMILGYPGQPDVPLARLLSRLHRAPLVWDVLMSIYLIAEERGLGRRSRFTLAILRQLEKLDCSLPDRLLIDTQEYADWYQENYRVDSNRIRLLPLGADDRIFRPSPITTRENDDFLCIYYGTYIPNHGVQFIIEAARILSVEPGIQFEMIGRGPGQRDIVSMARSYGLNNTTFIDWLPVEDLVKRAADADIILGTFGVTPQSMMTMQNKIHEGLAMARAVLNGESPVMHSTLKHGEHIFLCAREDPEALAQAILTLRDDPILRERIAYGGYSYYQKHLTFQKLGARLRGYLEEMILLD